ncbi:MAG: hypothetical protein PHV82_06460 [Victivallaceae bacterium]|nr:hypothetical protein [Victivallaceae bacterium]
MKKMILTLISMTAFMFSINGIAAAPTSTDKEVQARVIQIAKEALADRLAPVLYPEMTGVPVGLLGAKVTYKYLKAQVAKDPDVQKVIDAVDAEISQTKIFLSDIKTDAVDEKANKAEFSADLTVGKKILLVMYSAQVDKDGKLQVKVSGLDYIYDGKPVMDLKNVKPLPFTKEAVTQLREFQKKIIAVQRQGKDEFETKKEFQERISKDAVKVCKDFFKNSIVKQNIFEVTCKSRRPASLYFNIKEPSIDCNELIDVINMAGEMQIDNLFYNVSCIKDAAEVDFAGVVKTKKDQIKGYQKFKCTIAEAKQIKKNLGNSWDCNVKLWLKLSLDDLRWHIVKVWVIPVKKK